MSEESPTSEAAATSKGSADFEDSGTSKASTDASTMETVTASCPPEVAPDTEAPEVSSAIAAASATASAASSALASLAAPTLPAAANAANPQFCEAGLAQQKQPGFLLNLNDKQAAALEEFREVCKDATNWEIENNHGRFRLDDRTLLRFLRARDFNVKKSAKMLHATLEWRDGMRPSTITLQQIPTAVRQQFQRFIGFDRERRPIILYQTELWKHMEYDDEEYKKVGPYFAERAEALLPPGVEQFTLIFDMTGYQFGGEGFARRMSMAKYNFQSMSEQYPERLFKALVFNVPFIFRAAWAMLSIVLPAKTKAKVVMNASQSQLLEYIDPSVLTPHHGGTRDTPYDPAYLLSE